MCAYVCVCMHAWAHAHALVHTHTHTHTHRDPGKKSAVESSKWIGTK